MEIHVVRPGDTLYGIAVRYQADPAVLHSCITGHFAFCRKAIPPPLFRL